MQQVFSALTKRTARKGFTLIELLVVIGILAILLAIVLVAINPARQFAQANNTQRSSDVNALLNAIHQYAVDNNGTLPTGIEQTAGAISTAGVDICTFLVNDYLAALPVDPTDGDDAPVTECGTAYNTAYEVAVSTESGRITVTAPAAELGQVISITR